MVCACYAGVGRRPEEPKVLRRGTIGYYCTFGGEIHLSKEAADRLMATEIEPGFRFKELLEECFYESDTLYVYFDGKACNIENLIDAVTAAKDIDTVDELRYAGEDPDDYGWYYIKPGKWVFVHPQKPPVPSDDDPSWHIVTLPERK